MKCILVLVIFERGGEIDQIRKCTGNSVPRVFQQNSYTAESDPKASGKRKGTGIERGEKGL
jgi:hypothetical protein